MRRFSASSDTVTWWAVAAASSLIYFHHIFGFVWNCLEIFDLNGHNLGTVESYLVIRFFLNDSIGFFVDIFARSNGYDVYDSFRGYAINYPESADSIAH